MRWVIDALEAGDYRAHRPGGVRQGTSAANTRALLGLPAAEIMAGYESRARRREPRRRRRPIMRLRTARRPSAARSWPTRRRRRRWSLLVVGGIAVVEALARTARRRPPQRVPLAATSPARRRPTGEPAAEARLTDARASRRDRDRGGGGQRRAAAVPAAAQLAAAAAPPAARSSRPPGVGRARLRLSFSADSWVDVHDAAGKRMFAGNGRANSVKTISGMAPMRVYLGFASGVQLEINDRAVAIGPQFVAGDVARFEAGADGVLRRDPHGRCRVRSRRRAAARRAADGACFLSKIIEPLRGVHDVLPAQIAAWQHLERITREVFAAYGYEEFRVPVIEQTQLFKRSIGDFTDIVEKEMFSFVDQGEDHITLRPEATAGIVRAVISNGLLREDRLRVWCMGPMFRRERPQAGRYRQFHQIDAEAFGFEGPDVDAEMILLSARLLRRLGLTRIKLLVNSLGTPAVARGLSRAAHRLFRRARGGARRGQQAAACAAIRCASSTARIREMQRLIAGAPLLLDSLDAESRAHFECAVRAPAQRRHRVSCRAAPGARTRLLHAHGVRVDHGCLGSQSTVCAGGRYDGLVAQLGGADTPGIGWAMGQERIVMLLEKQGLAPPRERPQVYLVLAGERSEIAGLQAGGAVARCMAGSCSCRSISAAAASRRNSSARTRAARSLRWCWGRTRWRAGSSPSRRCAGELAQEECPIDANQ